MAVYQDYLRKPSKFFQKVHFFKFLSLSANNFFISHFSLFSPPKTGSMVVLVDDPAVNSVVNMHDEAR